MAKKILACDECGTLFRVDYSLEKKKKCPSCKSSKIVSLYRQYNLRR